VPPDEKGVHFFIGGERKRGKKLGRKERSQKASNNF